MRLFQLFLMTTSISLMLIMESDGTPLMALLDGSFLGSFNRTNGSSEPEVRNTSKATRLSKKLRSRKEQEDRNIAEEEERKNIESLWDPILNQSYDFSSIMDYDNTTSISKKLGLEDQESLFHEEEQNRTRNVWQPVFLEDYNHQNHTEENIVNQNEDYDNRNQTEKEEIGENELVYENNSKDAQPKTNFKLDELPQIEENWYPISNQSFICNSTNSSVFRNQTFEENNFKLPCLSPKTIENRSPMESYKKIRKRIQVKLYIRPVVEYGREYYVFATIPKLGKTNFVLNITVDTNDYLINEIFTAVQIKHTGWGHTKNLRALLEKFDIRGYKLRYNRCYFYRSTATFYNTKTQLLIGKVSSLVNRHKLLTSKARTKITVRGPKNVDCIPSLNLEFCKNPEEPVAISPWGHLEFFATIGDECRIVEYKDVEWNYCDIILFDHVEEAIGLVYKLLPYKLNFHQNPDGTKVFLLRVEAKINDVFTVARCYVTYRTPQVEPQILGNELRKVDVRKPVSIDGSSSMDRIKKFESAETKDFFWSCRSLDDPGNKYCTKDMAVVPTFRLPANALKPDSQYDFSLTVVSRINPDNRWTASQVVRGTKIPSFTPQILCRRNCALGVYAPLDSVHLIPKCDDCPSKVKKRYEWWVKAPGTAAHLESRHKYLILHHAERILSIRLKVILANKRWAETFYTLRRNDGPQKGRCEISPYYGLQSVTIFEIQCLGFESPYSPLTFRYKAVTGVIASNVPFNRFKVTLPVTRWVKISICDTIDMCVEHEVDVVVLPLSGVFRTQVADVMADVPRLLLHGQWNRAFVTSLVGAKFIQTTNKGREVYAYVKNIHLHTGSQLEQLTSLATHILLQLTPVDYRGATLMGEMFAQLSDIFEEIIQEHEWLHRDAYQSLTAMHMFFMSVLGVKSEHHSVAMCKPYNPECLNLQRIDFEKNFAIEFDPLILLRINSWMMNTWYLYRCVYFIGVMATQRHHPYDDALAIHSGGIAYQINVTEVTDNTKDIILETIDKIHVIQLSKALLHELESNLKNSIILFQTISQQNHHNIFWWYPDPLPSKTSVLIIHAYSPEKFFTNAEEAELKNPLIYKTNISQFNDAYFTQWMANSSIRNSTEIHIYSLMLNHKAMLAVRIVSCSELMLVKMRMHRWPTLGQIRQRACRITPEMAGKRIWLANSCDRSRAYVAIHRPGETRFKKKKLRTGKKKKDEKKRLRKDTYFDDYDGEEEMPKSRYLNYTILLEIYHCNFWKNRSLDPGWSEDYCTTTFEHSFGTSVQCTCHTLGTLSSRIFPISAELFVEHIPLPILAYNMIMLFLFMMLFFLAILKWIFNVDIITAHLREPNILQCENGKLGRVNSGAFNEGAEILLVIVTGGQEFAGTSSNIKFYFKSPNRPQTSYQITQDPGHPKLLRNSTNKLMIPRGNIYIPTRLALGIGRNGRYPSWYCRSITVVDLELNVQQLFLVESWIVRGHTKFMRSKYFTMGSYRKNPKYTWCQRLRQRIEQLYVSWFMISPITGPWQSNVGGIIMNRFERTCVWICNTAITLTVVSLYFGKSTVESIQEETRQNIENELKIPLVLVLAFYAFVICLLIHFVFEVLLLRWLWPQK
ncbi:uncharacterized protein [Drosophila takahashii]|uniref:uncharacterized protein isoform X2 n=1 Tax=Drosophila takahashii TaxID=29030 RepID=UPI0038992647